MSARPMPPTYLSPSADLSRHALGPLPAICTPRCCPLIAEPKPPLDELLSAKASMRQQDLVPDRPRLCRPYRLRCSGGEVRRIRAAEPPTPSAAKKEEEKHEEEEEEEDNDEENKEEEEEEEEEEVEDEEDEEGSDEEGEEEKEGNGVEDGFLKIKELEEYLEKDEEREYGEIKGKKRKKFGDLDGDEEEEDFAESAKYEDFFGGKKKSGGKKDDHKKGKRSSSKVEFHDEPEELDLDGEPMDDSNVDIQENGTLSTHEKQLLKIQSKIEQMEKANMEPKAWTMQGEVTAAKRPKNSALEVDLDFEHNTRPPPPETEEVTLALEDLIKKRIIEGRFDDVQRASPLPSKAPKELKELDENKSKKGLAEIYEEEYAQQAGLAPAPLLFSDERKKEASDLFKRLCLKLDALSHFHFAPKPVIEEMSIQANVPALAMEEIAPVAVSDAAMLAPEEVFKGKGDIKEEKELTQAERKRRRANKKRKFKAERARREAKKAPQKAALSHSEGIEES
ncbi:uncharacterized protein A4U43_C05F19560 [Asparagus officinalis]|uniref:Uncharacterized protein n=1 Tax=Asparagus officinalis TaxID=4686 RepID=A0A5P1EY83_ASPOF|nr:uncharacterized protein A4U43_C05F19560 [Asparagus officinalis]